MVFYRFSIGVCLFLTPGIRALIAKDQAWEVVLDQCQYGVPYRKRTKLLIWGIPHNAFSFHKCSGKGGRCSKTNKMHLHLRGATGSQFLTKHAQVYSDSK